MCGSCVVENSSGFGCHCNGGGIFGKCPASSGQECIVCKHQSLKPADTSIDWDAIISLIDPKLLEKERADYQATINQQKQD